MAKRKNLMRENPFRHSSFPKVRFRNVVSHEPLSEDECNSMTRFAKVFGQLPDGFWICKKLKHRQGNRKLNWHFERVRARTMAMHSSSELQDAAILLFEQIKELGVNTGSCGFVIWENEKKDATFRMSSQDGSFQAPFTMPHTKTFVYKKNIFCSESGKDFFELKVSGEILRKNFDYSRDSSGYW
ncbi:MAG: hypothetical protein R2942_06280 [Ignavibacteria bacterium]